MTTNICQLLPVRAFFVVTYLFLAAALLATLSTIASAQTTIMVGSNLFPAILSEAELLGGAFQGQNFTLNPSTTFEINERGVIGPVGVYLRTAQDTPFDFGGSTVNINNGGLFASDLEPTFVDSFVSNVTLNVFDGGNVGVTLAASNSTINVRGGNIEGGLFANSGNTVNLSSGQIGAFFNVIESEFNMSGGEVGNFLAVNRDATANISGGAIADRLDVLTGGTLNLYGGSIGDKLDVFDGGTMNIFGGSVGSEIQVSAGGAVNLHVKEFTIDSIVQPLLPGETIEILTRNGSPLDATLADGSRFSIRLNDIDTFRIGDDLVHSAAALTVTRIPEPGSATLLSLTSLALFLAHRRATTSRS